jgi:hypothetical protein
MRYRPRRTWPGAKPPDTDGDEVDVLGSVADAAVAWTPAGLATVSFASAANDPTGPPQAGQKRAPSGTIAEH